MTEGNKTEVNDNSKNKINLSFQGENKEENNDDIDINDYLDFNDLELNSLSYEEAIKVDKRTFLQYYFSLVKNDNLLLFSFYPNNDYNPRLIKMFLYFFFFSLELTINALFFTDDTMHQIYEDKGSFNLIYQLPQIIYSTLLTNLISSLINYFSLTEESIEKIKEDKKKDPENIDGKIKKLRRQLKIKFILFFIFTFIVLLFFCFYITCFCGVYKNTQIHLIKDTVSSFLISQIYTFIICFLPTIFRRIALKADSEDKVYLYKISQWLENV